MPDDDINYEAIRSRVEQRFRERTEFIIHAVVYIGVNIGLWMIYFFWDSGDVPWPLIVTVLWGAGLFGHAAHVWSGDWMRRMKDREIDREIEKERLRRELLSMKHKNDEVAAVRLSDDGEWVSADEDDDFPSTARANRR